MSHQIYLLHLNARAARDDEQRDEVARLIHRVGGFILMATGDEALIVAFDERWLPQLRRHPAVAFCGGLHLDPRGAAAEKLRRLFAANVAAQLAARSRPMPAEAAGPSYRPLSWHRPALHDPRLSSGVQVTTHTPTTR